MITYHAQYISLYKLSIITYLIFSVWLIFLTRGFHSRHNYLIYQNILVLYKTGYKKQIKIHILFITVAYSNSTFFWDFESWYYHNTDLLLLILDTSVWGFSTLWGGGIPTSDIANSAPRLCLLLLLFNYSFRPTFFFSRFLDRTFPLIYFLLSICSHSYLKPTQIQYWF